jgi:ribosomal protein S18 acetylase RimI-like enzyme
VPPLLDQAARFQIDYRAASDTDLPFLAALYASTRRGELAGLGWPEPMLDSFLAQQHGAQHRHYRLVFPDGEWLVIEQSGKPVGRLYLNETEDNLHIVDIALAEPFRSTGIGSAILRDLIDQAHASGRSVSCRVEHANEPAARLYRRLGFELVGDDGLHARMLCLPLSPG